MKMIWHKIIREIKDAFLFLWHNRLPEYCYAIVVLESGLEMRNVMWTKPDQKWSSVIGAPGIHFIEGISEV